MLIKQGECLLYFMYERHNLGKESKGEKKGEICLRHVMPMSEW